MKRCIGFLLSAFLTVACGGPPEVEGPPPVDEVYQALAFTFDSPYGISTPVDVFLGHYMPNNKDYVVYRRKSDWNCQFYAADLYERNYVVNASTGADYMEIICQNSSCPGGGNGEVISCSNAQNPIPLLAAQTATIFNAFTRLEALGGNDVIACSGGEGGALNECHGGDGNDTILDYGSATAVYGENGDDVVWNIFSHGPYGSHIVSGGAGNDCLQDASFDRATVLPQVYDCGSGTDRTTVLRSGVINCETLVTSCL